MKLEKITDSKIRIFLSLCDLQKYNILINNISNDSINSQHLLQILLDMAEKEVNFKVEDCELLVEIITPSEKECIFTITKLYKDNLINNNLEYFILQFENFDNFIDLCYFLNNLSNVLLENFSINSCLFLYNDTYYLKIINTNYFSNLVSICLEFGSIISNNFYFNNILNEYGKIILTNNEILNCINNFKRQY